MFNDLIPQAPLPASGQKAQWHCLPGIAAAAAVMATLSQHQRFALYIAKDSSAAHEVYESLKFLSKGIDGFNLQLFPDQEVLPYDHFSPHPDITSDRLNTLYHLQSQQYGICIVSVSTLLTRLCPRNYINRDSLVFSVGEAIKPEQLKIQLDNAGYQHRENVFEHGEYAVRGSLIDIFPMGSDLPYRVELFDEEIESLRTFEPESQRSRDKIDAITLLPAGEFALDKEGINRFRDNWHIEFTHNPDVCPVYQDTVAGIPSSGIEAYLPMFFSETESLFDYLPNASLIFSFAQFEDVAKQFLGNVAERHEQQAFDATRPLLTPNKLYLSIDECFAKIKQFPLLHTSADADLTEPTTSKQDRAKLTNNPSRGIYYCSAAPNPALLIDEHADNPTHRIEAFLEQTRNNQDQSSEIEAKHVLFCVESIGRRELFLERLTKLGIQSHSVDDWHDFTMLVDESTNKRSITGVGVAAFNRGASFTSSNVMIVAEPEIFGVTLKPKARSQKDKAILAEQTIHSLIELQVGAPIVHIDHGVGRYLGLEHMPIDNGKGTIIDAEFLTLEYAGGDRLYVPVTSLHLISRYMGGDQSSAPLNKLGSESWGNAKRKAIANVHDVAAELLDVYARRKAIPGFPFDAPEEDFAAFCDQFPFEETVDQQAAIDAVILDMQADNAMDRLVCGDVGFGKTEVAMRAAFLAVNNGKQVMILVPTTLLAQQHQQNFVDRFADWPVKIETLSRFRTSAEQTKVMAEFAVGKVDILIGTHKLIQKDLKQYDLGLVVVDEEHRFGVRQKEQLKQLCANVDLLTMTATPIPRTLNMAMAGLRDLSIIATPPARRLSVKTFVHEKQTGLLKEALLRELLRGGQVFYLHNDVSSIERTAAELAALIPDARIGIGHGQMRERDLEQVMSDFYHKKFNVLVCTTIIETGIDIPNANTIIIDRADKFGLAQLHQLRGRVGRSHHQAYAYLFVPHRKLLSKDAEKRLQAIEEAQDLGAGFMLATHDLEIRGAGELLGDDQSGHMISIGFSLYLDMLDRAVTALKAGDEIDLTTPLNILGEINLHLPALIPDDYLPDIHNRLMLYKRIANAASDLELRDLKVEMIDRFGLLNEEINNLFDIMTIKLRCIEAGIKKIDAGEIGGYVEFSGKTAVDPITIVQLVQQDPECYRLAGATRLTFKQYLPESAERLQWIADFVDRLHHPE